MTLMLQIQAIMKNKAYDSDGKRIPLRMCAVCMSRRDKRELIRVAKTADGSITAESKQGRGVYLCKDEKCVSKAQKIHALERGLKSRVPKEIYEVLFELEQ